ncbi:YhgE/Pip domain-containing protein [Paenibacillus sp. YPG26]|uniref:YhgE/Pip domain-containing protein n=1 Tax=Paenibacillus sp. YPG26 TaxID=2878915 RepID=UPI00203FF899|nr:YhgE/Pip domain-containing protein [Paenibacillus sp. YPG26]USB34018.1 YhgE/Pip domain-containing protein [Paenibacillus sp. YPG26]
MKSMSVFFSDLISSFKKPKVIIPILVVLFIPVLYSGMFLTAFWDPYGKMGDLPVAVVNQDKGAEFNEKSLHVGEDLVAELRKSDDFKWEFVSRQAADEGMKDNKYYMTIVIPEDFSSKATTVMDEHPDPADILFVPNEGYNFLAGQIGGTAVKEIKSKVSAKVTEAYTETLLTQVEKVSGGLSDAGSGADTIHEGAAKLQDGAGKLKDNLAKLVEGTVKLQDGVTPLANGISSLNQGAKDLQNGAVKLSGGLGQLSAAEKQLENGAVAAQQGGTKLQAGLQSSLEGTTKLDAGLEAAQQGSSKLQAGMETALQGSGKVAEGADGVAKGLEQVMKASPELASNPQMQKLLAASMAVAKGSEQVHEGQQQLAQGVKSLNDAQQQLAQGSGQLVKGQQQLVGGSAQLNEGQSRLAAGMQQFGSKLSEAAAGSKELAAGTGKLSAGTEQLGAGVSKLTGGVDAIASGSKQLDTGAGQLKEGTGKLADGSGELATKLNDAAKQTSEVKASDDTVSMYAKPVGVTENKYNPVPNYGTGFAPYFLSLGLFVGALIATLVIPLRGSSVQEASGWNRFVSRTLSFGLMSLVQSLFAVTLVLYGLKLQVQNVPMMFLFSFITSLSFMFIIQALVTWLDNPGRFVAILILIIQLTTSAGTFPIELIPDWMKVFNPLLPMTYSVSGYKAVISSGDMHAAWSNVGVLAMFGGTFLILTLVYFLMKHKRNTEVENEQILTA